MMGDGLVGRAVRKEFPSFGVFTGVVRSFDAAEGFYRVVYEDGDAEDLELDEVMAILVADSKASDPKLDDSRVVSVRVDFTNDTASDKKELLSFGREVDGSGICKDEEDMDLVLMGKFGSFEGKDVSEKVGNGSRKRPRESGLDENVPLRRSARRAGMVILPAEDSPSKPATATHDKEECCTELVKLELPPSSKDLDLDGLPALDVFAVYACLRSFSRQLFLSPFHLDTFVAALRCAAVNPLIDAIHFALMQALRKRLEILSEEKVQSAIHCLRNLNWDLLDLTTWPVFVAEYLLLHGSVMRSDFKLARLNLLNMEYYKQPAAVKLEVLRCLCDDVVEVEAIRLELGIRMDGFDQCEDIEKNTARKKQSGPYSGLNPKNFPGEACGDSADGNSDECSLCGMDGNLICCDGCPAAFHSKCVGVVKDHLPEGSWYCPECVVERSDGVGKFPKLPAGAEVMGLDPHGRLFYSTCGYLLVTDSLDKVASCRYYSKNDLTSILELLRLDHPSYRLIASAINSSWGISVDSSHDYENPGQIPFKHDIQNGNLDGALSGLPKQDTCYYPTVGISKNNVFPVTEVLNGGTCFGSGPMDEDGLHLFPGLALGSNEALILDTVATHDLHAQISTVDPQNEFICRKYVDIAEQNGVSEELNGRSGLPAPLEWSRNTNCELHCNPESYVNHYSFGQLAYIASELIWKSPEDKETKKVSEDMILLQLKTVSEKYNSCWLAYQKLLANLQKEGCDWCSFCKSGNPSSCIFSLTDDRHFKNSKTCIVGQRSEKNKRSHIGIARYLILSIEDQIRALLSGHWKNLQYSDLWRKAVMKASDVASLKKFLLMLESNTRRVAFSPEWHKPSEFVDVVGSAAHVLFGVITSLNHVNRGRPGRRSSKSKVDSLGIYWWRGGKMSRQVFNWKMLPRQLVSKAARQAGCKLIPSILYPDALEIPRRTRSVAWRAAVEMSGSVAQLIFLINELQSNIQRTEFLSDQPSISSAAKEKRNRSKLFKKVIVRRKVVEGATTKYLLDFGKRDNIPPIVARYGEVHMQPSNGRKKYWLSESYVPFNVLKAYEERKLIMSKRKPTCDITEEISDFKTKKQKRRDVFEKLFLKAKQLENKLCGLCNLEVSISDAVNCKSCADFFHKRHCKFSKSTTTAYTCSKCKKKRSMQSNSKLKKSVRKRSVNPIGHLQQTTTERRYMTRNHCSQKIAMTKKLVINARKAAEAAKKGKCYKRKRGRLPKKLKAANGRNMRHLDELDYWPNWCTMKRSYMAHSYWLDGLHWTRETANKQAASFKEQFILPAQQPGASSKPSCCLCQFEYDGDSIFICCEKCGDWFHGDVYNLTAENINNLIGFKCHKCCLRTIPICPYFPHVHEAQLEPRAQETTDDKDYSGLDFGSGGPEENVRKLHDGSTALEHLMDYQDDENIRLSVWK